MLKAYYSKGCDSSALFAGREIEQDKSYRKHLNQYDVIHIDMASMWSNAGKENADFLGFLQNVIFEELWQEYGTVDISECRTIAMALAKINHLLGNRFVIIIDEWDTVFREAKHDQKLQDAYISLLRALFKSEEAKSFVALAYITGILPIKKYGIESALNNFDEYTMISPKLFAKYFGFTSKEVQELCEKYDMDFDKMREWYDGYSFRKETHIYNPNSVVKALLFDSFESYWSNTETFSSLKGYISMNFEGLRDDIIRMFTGERCTVMVGNFENDLVSYKSKDDVMTALIHLGYLAYDFDMREAYIPNKEVQEAFEYAILETDWKEIAGALRDSDRLLKSTWRLDTEAVAAALEQLHSEAASVLQYNDENSLSCAILKCDQSPQEAIAQIRERKYMEGLSEYRDNLLLVGISYDRKTKKHSCVIEWAQE